MSAALSALALAAAAVLVSAAPAYAHDELLSTDPAAGATLDALPAQLTLTFSGDLIAEPGATQVQVTDAAGVSLSVGDPVVDANVVTQALSSEASGAVQVLWRVVSSDGHPISGELAFTVTEAPTPTTEPTATPTPTATETTEPTPTPTETAEPAPDADSTFADVRPWVIGGLLFAAVGGAVVYLLVSRARRERARNGSAPGVPGDESEHPSDR